MMQRPWIPTLVGCLLLVCLSDTAATQSSSASSSSSSDAVKTLPRRERHLDFMDADTLAYYLGVDAVTGKRLASPPPPSNFNHNVAVMFYAQRDSNSHYLAPAWDAIGQILNAGTRKSNLIMALFDCELDQQHFDLCSTAGISHYPALLYISPSRKFPHAPALIKKPLAHTTFFPGNWKYDKSILDWLRTMQAMTGWSTFWSKQPLGWWKALQKQDPATAAQLPVGVPVTSGTTASSSASSATAELAVELEKLKEKTKQYEDIIVRSSTMLDATLFPLANPLDAASIDVYAYLNATNGWDSTAVKAQVVRSCAMEIALDYCSRLTTHTTDKFVEQKTKQQQKAEGEEAQQQTLEELEAELRLLIQDAEPYCDGVEQCVLDGFTKESCRPPVCPFQQDVPCRYLTVCFDESMQADYATALGVSLTEDSAADANNKKRGWF